MAVKKQTLQVRLKQSTITQLKQIAENKEETLSEYVRKLLETHLNTR